MYHKPSLQILKFNLRPDLYTHASWLQDVSPLFHKSSAPAPDLPADHASGSGTNLVLAEYLLKQYGLYNNYYWSFHKPLEKIALQNYVTLLNNYIIALIYSAQIRRTVKGSDYRMWLQLLSEPVMKFALLQAPYLPTHDLPALALQVTSVEKQSLSIMRTGLEVLQYLFSCVHPSIWKRIKLHFPRQIFLQRLTNVDLNSKTFHDWFVQKIVTRELGHVIH